MKKKMILSNDEGSVLVIALVMLALLTTLGIMSTNTTSVDLQISQNERIHRQNFNFAEAAAMEAAQRLIDDDINGNNYTTATGATDWITLCDETDSLNPCEHPYRDPGHWTDTSANGGADTVVTSTVNPDPSNPSVFYTVQYNGEFAGASLGLGIPNVRLDKFTCYGRYSSPTRGEVMIEVALTKATS